MDQLLAVGAKGPSVVELQKLLNQKLGPQVALNPDGQYGAKTKSAVNKFQEANWLVVDGMVGPATWACLRGR